MEDDFFDQQPNLLDIRYRAWTSGIDIPNSTILDLGCGSASFGKYVLDRSALHYFGVDFDPTEIDLANANLNKYPNSKFTLLSSSIDDFLKNHKTIFDAVFLGAVIHGNGDIIQLCKALSKISNKIIIETAHPLYIIRKFKDDLSLSDLHDLEYNNSIIEIFEEDSNQNVRFLHSLGYLTIIFDRLGFTKNTILYEQLKKELPNIYGFLLDSKIGFAKRYAVMFNRSGNSNIITWEDEFNNV